MSISGRGGREACTTPWGPRFINGDLPLKTKVLTWSYLAAFNGIPAASACNMQPCLPPTAPGRQELTLEFLCCKGSGGSGRRAAASGGRAEHGAMLLREQQYCNDSHFRRMLEAGAGPSRDQIHRIKRSPQTSLKLILLSMPPQKPDPAVLCMPAEVTAFPEHFFLAGSSAQCSAVCYSLRSSTALEEAQGIPGHGQLSAGGGGCSCLSYHPLTQGELVHIGFFLSSEPSKPSLHGPHCPSLPLGTFFSVGFRPLPGRASKDRGLVPARAQPSQPPNRTSAGLAARLGAILALSIGSVPQLIPSQVHSNPYILLQVLNQLELA